MCCLGNCKSVPARPSASQADHCIYCGAGRVGPNPGTGESGFCIGMGARFFCPPLSKGLRSPTLSQIQESLYQGLDNTKTNKARATAGHPHTHRCHLVSKSWLYFILNSAFLSSLEERNFHFDKSFWEDRSLKIFPPTTFSPLPVSNCVQS